MQPKSAPEEYRRRLPHIQPKDAVFFITFSLKGALPKHIVVELSETVAALKQNQLTSYKTIQNAHADYCDQIEDLLHSEAYGNHWLTDTRVAEIVANSIHHMDGEVYKLVCYCIMSNHVHMIVYKVTKPLYKVMHSLKSFTANECNRILNRKGAFWQREYYDRIVRDRNDLAEKVKYVINNPVKAGNVSNWREYQFSYCRPEFMD